jgi:hypothetical protein
MPNYEKIQYQLAYFQPYQDLLDGIEAYVKEQQEEEEEENDDQEEEKANIEVEDKDDDPNIETTDIKDIKDFINSQKNKKVMPSSIGGVAAIIEGQFIICLCISNIWESQ